jgi:hypothetical protein
MLILPARIQQKHPAINTVCPIVNLFSMLKLLLIGGTIQATLLFGHDKSSVKKFLRSNQSRYQNSKINVFQVFVSRNDILNFIKIQ